jgi:hypothetical protein
MSEAPRRAVFSTHRAILMSAMLLGLSIPPAARAGTSLSATVVGAGNPIVGSTVTVYAAGPSAATVVGSGQTDSSGTVSITMPNPGGNAVFYAIAAGGDADHGSNSAIALMSVFGTASNYTSPIVIDELTTVASVWSMRAFIHSDRSIFGPSPGLQNAALTVTNLADLAHGKSSSLLSSSSPDKLNTLADLVAACVGSSGASSSDCAGLFSNATPVEQTPPQDTMAAAVAIANNPVLNLASLFAISSHSGVYAPSYTEPPYNWLVALNLPAGVLIPTVVAIDSSGAIWVGGREPGVAKLLPPGVPAPGSPFTGGGLQGNLTEGMAIDPSGHVWILNDYPATTISELDSDGGAISPASGYPLVTNQYLPQPDAIAADQSGNVWITNTQQYPWYGRLFEVGQSGQVISQFDGPPATFEPTSVTIDAAGNAWLVDHSTRQPRLRQFNSMGPISRKDGYKVAGGHPNRLAIDEGGNIWISNDGIRVGPKKPPYHYIDWIAKLNPKAKALSPPHGYRGGGISAPIWIAIDGAGNVWVYDLAGVPTCGGFTNFDISELDPNGNPISPQVGYPIAPHACGGSEPYTESPPDGLSIDPSGNIWLANVGNDALLEIVGAAAPVKTPLIGPAQSP